MKYVLAVSGGVDSVVLLDMFMQGLLLNPDEKSEASTIVVAHFDHGIRSDSAADAEFVGQLAARYGLPYETRREELGEGASEDLARTRRYVFLRELAANYDATIVTAHHGDDIVETIAINLERGTGWRGLTVLDSPDIWRPLLGSPKTELVEYAHEHKLEWREDSTNSDTKYLRNAMRQKLRKLDHNVGIELRIYRERQLYLKQAIDEESRRLVGESPYKRYFFIMTSELVGSELLRTVIMQETGKSVTRPQLIRALLAIKTLQAGRKHDVAEGVELVFTKTEFVVSTKAKVLS